MVSGVISVLLAGLLLIGFPSTATWTVGLPFGINLLTTGISLVAVAMVGRDASSIDDDELPGTGSPGT